MSAEESEDGGDIWSAILPLRKPGYGERPGSIPKQVGSSLKGKGNWGLGAEKTPAVTAGWNIPPPRQFQQFLFVRVITKLNVLITGIAYAFLLRLEHHKHTEFTPQRAKLLASREGASERVHFNFIIKQA